MRAMPKTTSLVTTMARRAPAPKGFSLTISLIVEAVIWTSVTSRRSASW